MYDGINTVLEGKYSELFSMSDFYFMLGPTDLENLVTS